MSFVGIYGPDYYNRSQDSRLGCSGSFIIGDFMTGSTIVHNPELLPEYFNNVVPRYKPTPLIRESKPRIMNGHADYSGIDALVTVIRMVILGSAVYLAWAVWIN